MDRKQEQADLIYKLGLLLRPILDVAEHPDKFTAEDRARIRARFVVDAEAYRSEVRTFSHSEPGHVYTVEFGQVKPQFGLLVGAIVENLVQQPDQLSLTIKTVVPRLQQAIAAFPVPVDTTIHEAYTPFSTYCKLKTLCATVQRCIVYTDRYMDSSIFHRYLSGVPEHVELTLLTWPRNKHHNKRMYDEFIDVSRMFAQERGPDTYRLLVESTLHDRMFRCDDQLLHLGGSVKDAGSKSIYTLSKIDPTPENVQKLDDLLSAGTELFGPTNPNHP